MPNLLITIFYGLMLASYVSACVNMWEAQTTDTVFCQVQTSSGQACVFPFTYNNQTYHNCIITGPSNPSYLPQCITDTNINTWSTCIVPTNAVVTYVTTRKAGSLDQNGASLNGGTLVWIYGLRFAPNLFNITTSALTSNSVILESSTASYTCEIHVDKVTTTQITCWTPQPIAADTYFVRVYINNNLLPKYQYVDPSKADVVVSSASTPVINSIVPNRGIPGSYLNISGQFNTNCYTRDDITVGCADDSGSRITRVYFGAQSCDLINPTTLQFYQNLTTTNFGCLLQGQTVAIFNASILVSEDNGRSIANSNTYLVTPDQLIYNFQTYADITNISPNFGSTQGQTTVQITGKYLYHSSVIPANILVSGSPCNVINFDNTNLLSSVITCQTSSSQAAKTDYYGNRGINLQVQNNFTAFSLLNTTVPSANAQSSWLDVASYQYPNSSDVTVWLSGYLAPSSSSDYLFSLTTNGYAKLFISTDTTSANKQLVASYDPSTNTSVSLTNNLVGGQLYYLQAIASKAGGNLNINLNTKMYTAYLNTNTSSMIKTEVQKITISSTIIKEETEISYASLQTANISTSVNEIQSLELFSQNPNSYFVLSFDGVNTYNITYGASASVVQAALNDLPTLSGVTVTSTLTLSGSYQYNLTFSAAYGDVPAITEITGNFNAAITELVKGVTAQTLFQFSIQNSWSKLFDIVNDPVSKIQSTINELFTIRCPVSIQNVNPMTTFAIYDYETNCAYDEQPLSSTAFCGSCARKNNRNLFWNVNSPLTYNQLCFAYKAASPLSYIQIQVYLDGDSKTAKNVFISVTTIADKQWHYLCADMYQGFLKQNSYSSSVYPKTRLTLLGAVVDPVINDLYIDVVAIRNNVPSYIDDASLLSRRIFPSLQMVYNSLTIKRKIDNQTLNISYRPNNCTVNLNPSSLRQAVSNVPAVRRISQATGSVGGSFALQWNSQILNGISASSSAMDMKSFLQSIQEIGAVSVIRTQDCAGYQWEVDWVYGGNKKPINISSSLLTGNNASISAQTTTDGGIEYYPIQGDMLRTAHAIPQFSVNINGIPSKCSASCSFQWSTSSTPNVSSIDTSNPSSIKLTGSGFDATNISNNQVFIGATLCAVTSATSSVINCTPGQSPVGTYGISLNVNPDGLAQIISSITTFTYSLSAVSVSPSISGVGGGVLLNITGTGFSNKTVITVDSISCPIQSYTYNLIQCISPSNPTVVNKTVDINIVDGANSANVSQQFTYDYTNTPIISSVSLSTNLNVNGGQVITITGTNFNTTLNQVFFGTVKAISLSFSNNQIVVQSPSIGPGSYSLIIPTGYLGYAQTTVVMQYTLYVSSFSPNTGSIRGGTTVAVYGEGFSTNCSQNKVSFGPRICSIIDCTSQWIRCQTSYANNVYQINNNGYDPYYGKGFAWNNPYLNVNLGDYVRWSWSAPGTISNINYFVQQVSDPTSTTPSGFSSGSPSISGTFTYQFNTIGTYYYWSGFVDENQVISFRGIVKVGPSVDVTQPIQVSVAGFNATTCTTSCSTAATPPPALSCPGTGIILSSCSISSPPANNFLFTTCSLANVSSISASNGTAGDTLTVTGTGFSSTSCENQILIGSYSCPISSSTSTQLVCQIGTNSGLIPGVSYSIEIQIKNSGNAIRSSSYEFNFLPQISSISPNIGSSNGGTSVVIYGDGFSTDGTVFIISGTKYSNSNALISYSNVSLITSSSASESNSINFYVNGVQAICKAIPNCNYTFSSSVSPTISAISPTNIQSSSVITINGTQFGYDKTKLTVSIGNSNCNVNAVTPNSITCSLASLKVGQQNVVVNLMGVGNAIQTIPVFVTGLPYVQSLSQTSGGIYGGSVLIINGNGFSSILNTTVKIGNSVCVIQSVTLSQITCNTSSNSVGNYSVSIKSNNVDFPSPSFFYDLSLTPNISNISPISGLSNQTLTITGTVFGSSTSGVSVSIGSSPCVVQSATSTQITCITGSHNAGTYPVVVQVNSNGFSNMNIQFTYMLSISSVSTIQGGYGGGLEITLAGNGFSGSNTTITICNNKCPISNSDDASRVSCIVPAYTYSSFDTNCTLVVTVNGATASQSFTYKSSLSSSLSSVSPIKGSFFLNQTQSSLTQDIYFKGGTGGGVQLTITGTFPSVTNNSEVTVTIAGTQCEVTSSSTTSIICLTGPYQTASGISTSITAPVSVFFQNYGYASNTNNVQFQYINLWSNIYTWGGTTVPQEGELPVISFGQIIYFDAVTPILKGVIIQGGSLIFDDNQDVHLNAEYIIICDGGSLQVGTKEKPFMHKATITMYGTLRSIELPIFGAKVLALRNGTLDLHGAPVGVTWTYLSTTASAQSTQIQLKDPVSWNVGDQIVIATTGDSLSIGQSETNYIKSLSSDKQTITLQSPLQFQHLSETRTIGGVSVKIRAEVGLLSRNVLFNAINDNSWNALRSANACPDGFDPGEFSTMTCFLGRYGPEIGSDQFGATIMINSGTSNTIGNENVIARISNVELYHVGQSYRLGRYAIHFHMIGNSPSSYVSECAIHQSFNRAVNIHASNYITVEKTVIYDIMGGAFFLEDGVEIGNVFQYNLAIFVRESTSLLNEDSTPAAFWATNPNNTWQHNAVAGGTHFGYWYRLLDHPDGPSFNSNYCPKKIPLGKFFNNSVHSVGRFGLWIFPGFHPSITGACSDNTGSPATFDTFLSYNNDKGAEWVMANNVQFKNFVVFDHKTAGIETKTIVDNSNANTPYSAYFYNANTGPSILNSVIIGNSDPLATSDITSHGLVIAWDRGQLIQNVSIINFFNNPGIIPTSIDGKCSIFCGGWTTQFREMSFTNVQYRTKHRWSWDVVMLDLDGTLTSGVAGNVVVSETNITDADKSRCRVDSRYNGGAICSNTKDWIRFAFDNAEPSLPVLVDLTNYMNATDFSPILRKRLTHPDGYMMAMEANQAYELNFEGTSYPTNISYTGIFYGLKINQYLIIKHQMKLIPDQVIVFDSLATQSLSPLSYSQNKNGDWYWDNSTRTLSYIVYNNSTLPFLDAVVSFKAKKCRYSNCQIPSQPYLSAPATSRPSTAIFWSNIKTWQSAYIIRSNKIVTDLSVPQNYDSIQIPSGVWVVVDTVLPILTRVQIDGVLEFNDSLDNTLSVNDIFINGGQLIVGWENQPFTHNLNIELTGDRSIEALILPNGFDSMGEKAIGVYGGLDLHGIPRKPSWTQLSQTAMAGTNQLTLVQPVDWILNEEIVISTTSYSAFQTETFKITAVSSNNLTITLNSSLQFDHIVQSETFANGKSYTVAAGVGLLTRNIKVIGGQYSNQYNELFGSRIIVSDYANLVYASDSNSSVSVYYKGFARISDVEFNLFGQFSTYGGDDFAYGILFSNLGVYNPLRPSYVKNSAFHNGFSSAVGILTSSSIPITNNVIHRTLDYAIWVEGDSNIISNNLVVLNIWSGTMLQQYAPFNIKYFGAIDVSKADSVVVENNLIAGSERFGLHTRGSPCSGASIGSGYNHSITGNSIYGTLIGVSLYLPTDSLPSQTCLQFSNFVIYKSISAGLYAQSTANLVLDSNSLIDNQINIFPQVYTPSSTSHISDPTRSIVVSNNLIVGKSPSYNCQSDIVPNNINSQYYTTAVSFTTASGGKIGVVWANFLNTHNGAPLHGFFGIMSYNSINGVSHLYNNTFAHFNPSCGSTVDAAITTNKNNDDGQLPVVIKNTYLYDVAIDSKVFLHRPNIGKINPSDCVDMDCDGLKKNLLTDMDGSFLGSPGTVTSQSEFGWGEQSRGLGDFRIPALALVDSQGHQLNASSIYSYPGIVRDQTLCTYRSSWQGYECHGLNYAMLIIESMDNDTESRRLSPVAVVSDNGYLDLINGPQDSGWCFGYTCQKRLSTFLSLVVTNHSYDIYLSSTPPNKLRFRLIQTDSTFKIRLSMSYTTSNGINVYNGINNVNPKNADTTSGRLLLKDPQGNTNQYMPQIHDAPGTNFMDRTTKKVYFSIDGSTYIDLILSQEIFITFGVTAMNTDAFFNTANIVSNIALLLGVPSSMIRRVQIVSASGSYTRMVRQSSNQISQLLILINNDPPATSDSALLQSNMNQIQNITALIAGQYYLGKLQVTGASLNLTINSLNVQVASTQTDLKVISGLNIVQDISGCRAQSPCDVQPIIQLVDQNNQAVNIVQFGNQLAVNVTVYQGSTSVINQYIAYFNVNGTTQLQTLGFYNEATGVTIRYNLIGPSGLSIPSSLKATSASFSVTAPIFSVSHAESDLIVTKGVSFSSTFYIVDSVSGVAVPNPDYKSQSFSACLDIYQLSSWQPSNATLQASTKCASLNLINNLFSFTSLSINTIGMYVLKISMISNDGLIKINTTSNNIRVVSPNVYDNSNYHHNFQLTFNGTFVTSQKSIYISTIYNYYVVKYNIELIGDILCISGSVKFSAGVDQSNATVQQLLTVGSYNDSYTILPGYPLVYFSLNTYQFNISSKSLSSSGSSLSSSESSKISSSSSAGLIAGIVVAVVALGGIVAASIFAYRYISKKNKKVGNNDQELLRINSGKKLLNNNDFDKMENDGVNISKSKKLLSNPEYDQTHNDGVRSPRLPSAAILEHNAVPTELFVSLPSALNSELTSASLRMIDLGSLKVE